MIGCSWHPKKFYSRMEGGSSRSTFFKILLFFDNYVLFRIVIVIPLLGSTFLIILSSSYPN